jgi:hypothetical protein
MGGSGSLASFIRRRKRSTPNIAFGYAGAFNSQVGQATIDESAISTNFFGDAINRIPGVKQFFDLGKVFLAALPMPFAYGRRPFAEFIRVTDVGRSHYDGPVYNFETESGLVIASTIISHNCRCWVEHQVDFSLVELAA